MTPGASLINTSRGAVVDEPGPREVLLERPDITAILDVTRTEPPSADSPMPTLPNVILTPRIAGSTGTEVARLGWWIIEEARSYIEGRPRVASGLLREAADEGLKRHPESARVDQQRILISMVPPGGTRCCGRFMPWLTDSACVIASLEFSVNTFTRAGW